MKIVVRDNKQELITALNSVLFPGMGTGTGMIGPKDAAFAMLSGIHSAIKNRNDLDDMPEFDLIWTR